eukprot:4027255-Amphidinium_carterae.1
MSVTHVRNPLIGVLVAIQQKPIIKRHIVLHPRNEDGSEAYNEDRQAYQTLVLDENLHKLLLFISTKPITDKRHLQNILEL